MSDEPFAKAPWAVIASNDSPREFRVVFDPRGDLRGYGGEVVTRACSMEDARKIAYHYMQRYRAEFKDPRTGVEWNPPKLKLALTAAEANAIVDELLKETVEE